MVCSRQAFSIKGEVKMTRHEKNEGIPLQAEDRLRAMRLSEEITSRLMELALITARTLGKEVRSPSRLTFTQNFESASLALQTRASAEDFAEVTVIQLDDAGNCVGVYENPPGICRPCGPGD
jgi:hypothetical protein